MGKPANKDILCEKREPFFHTFFIKDQKLPKWRAGRYFIYLGQYRKAGRRSIGLEWTSGLRGWLGFRFQWGGEEQDFQLMLGLGLVTIWITTESWLPWEHRIKSKHTTGIMYSSGGVTAHLWAEEKYANYISREYYIRPLDKVKDKILGKRKYSTEVISEHNEVITLDKDYPVFISMEIATWKRPRWFPLNLHRPQIKMQVPVPGKGDNSWDLGEDCIYDVTMAGRKTPYTVEEVLLLEKESIMKTRLKYGGIGWTPEV
jgi:hypothetical protein